MALMHRLEMRQGQSLVMTPQLLQAIKLLQLSHLDLATYVEGELERNPLLESAAPDDGSRNVSLDEPAPPGGDGLDLSRGEIESAPDGRIDEVFQDSRSDFAEAPAERAAGDALAVSMPAWQSSGGGGGFDGGEFDPTANLTEDENLRDHLERQLLLATADPLDRLIGRHVIDAVDDAGYLGESCAEIAERLGAEPARVERLLGLIQTFSPTGIAARNLAECLALQLKERDRYDPAMAAVLSRLDLVARRDVAGLKRLCGLDDEDISEMLAEIRSLDPKPGRGFGGGPVQVLVPDVFVRAAPDGSWLVELNPDTLPRVLVNQAYHARVSRTARTDGDKSFISECLQSANWLTRSLEQRSKTILKVASEIVRQQDGFFAFGVTHLRPLNLKTVADAIGMHESTVSRVTSNKAIGTARGTFEMKYFFTASIPAASGGEAHSSESVRHRIKQLVDAEGPDDVLSDDALVKRLKDEGIDIARRTVAKYRESLRIPSSVDRRRDKKLAALR
ncbi:RNA polymerase factor sigma-54 [Enterovirga rhinocerotis]|uniref:RNA polymerase sigma-54 factor n=1 Tax=Enterovirga rhinocerotis TaxID=1339210 RepID=A0A4R7BVJ2_9HYPH|nr:RNA polymerase factor sigma-54 [Enterovirga rhinocerotis]TDR89092.1 RNA polymerase RpoN-/SigL-like sigma 54 subunit [Enterovirga rhinocerotis]